MKPAIEAKGNKCVTAVTEERLFRRAAFCLNVENMKEDKTESFQDTWGK